MFLKIKNKIDQELLAYTGALNRQYGLAKLSPVLNACLKEFIRRDGKRIRPILFCIGYLGWAKKTPYGLYRAALAIELLHDFMLIHDDIIDKSATRRGLPSLHALLQKHLAENKKIKFNGQDLAILAGDVLYAMALEAFLAIEENPRRKELALKKFIRAAFYTGSGEFMELLLGIKPLEKVTQKDIYKIYDYKTANYTFASPLAIGATLAGAKQAQIKKLYSYGMLLGRAFQIRDDILGTFGTVKQTGKSNLTDIQEAKKTLLVWYAFSQAHKKDKQAIKKIMQNKTANQAALNKMRAIITATGALGYAEKQIQCLCARAQKQIQGLNMRAQYKQALDNFSQKIFK